jgi:hypothetical protein
MRGITEASSSLDKAYSAGMSLTGLRLVPNANLRSVALSVTLTNVGAAPLSQVRAAATFVGLATDPTVSGLLVDPPVELEAGESLALSDSFDLSSTAAQTLKVTVGAGGLGPAGNAVSASIEDSVALPIVIN